MDGTSTSTLDHLADVIAQATTEKLIAVALILFVVLLIAAILLAWRLIPVLRSGNQERANISAALDKQQETLTQQNALIEALHREMLTLHRIITERRGWFTWLNR
jgi:Tfp pilus assembly protein PilN